jgi:hypothetical protein
MVKPKAGDIGGDMRAPADDVAGTLAGLVLYRERIEEAGAVKASRVPDGGVFLQHGGGKECG